MLIRVRRRLELVAEVFLAEEEAEARSGVGNRGSLRGKVRMEADKLVFTVAVTEFSEASEAFFFFDGVAGDVGAALAEEKPAEKIN